MILSSFSSLLKLQVAYFKLESKHKLRFFESVTYVVLAYKIRERKKVNGLLIKS